MVKNCRVVMLNRPIIAVSNNNIVLIQSLVSLQRTGPAIAFYWPLVFIFGEVQVMDDLSVKKPDLIDSTGSAPNKRNERQGLAGLAASFRELVNSAGFNVDNGLNAISDKAGISATTEAPKHADLDDGYDHEPKGQDQDRSVDRGYNEGRGRDDHSISRADRPDDYDREPSANNRDNGHEARADNSDDHRDDAHSETPTNHDEPSNNDHHGDSESHASDDGENGRTVAAEGENGDKKPTVNQNAGNHDDPSAANAAASTAAHVATPSQVLAAIAGQKIVGGTTLTETGAASETGKEKAATSLAQAAAATGKTLNNHAGAAHQGQGGNQAAQAQAAAAQQAGTKGEGEGKTGAAVRDQAQQLAKTLGADSNKVQVKIGVTQEAGSVTSKPLSSLTNAATLSSDGKAASQNGQQANNNATPGNANAVVAAATQQTQNTQSQAQQANSQGNQAQAATQVGGSEAKLAQAGPSSAQAGGATSAAADSSASSTTNNAAQQTQNAEKSTLSQTSNGTRPANLTQNVVEQVSVKITKALQAGNDRISIKLSPAELGRVEVKMELGHDGRVMAVVTAEKQDTLDLLRRDSSDLQKALQEGGMDLDSGDMTFNLKGDEGELAENKGSEKGDVGEDDVADDSLDVPGEILTAQDGGILANGRIDVRA